ncbi:hypothetical protein D9M69_668980 [compost metagenome]
MEDDRQSVDGNDLFGAGALHIAQADQGAGFAVLDRARRGGQVGVAALQRAEAGAGAMGGDFDDQAAAVGAGADDLLLVLGVTGLQANRREALFLEQALDQRGPEFGADGVGALNAQGAAAVRRDRQGGEYRPGQGVADKTE